jgi:hypothetical protein
MAGFAFGRPFFECNEAPPYPDRAALRNHNIFWTDVVELSSRSEFNKRELELLLNGDIHACVHGFFRKQASDRVTVNIPSHVQKLRDQLLNFDQAFDDDNGDRALLSRYNNQGKKTSPSLNYGFSDGFTKGSSRGLPFLREQLFDAFTCSATEFNPIKQGRTRKDDLVWTSQTQWQCENISRNTSFTAQAFPPPCPDMAFYFPAFPKAHCEPTRAFPEHTAEARYARHATFENLSKETLRELRKHGLSATPFPISGDMRQMNVLPAYPWFISLLSGSSAVDRHGEAAIAATATLKMYENAARFSKAQSEQYEIPPAVLMTSAINEIRIWLAYSVKDDANIFTDSLSTQMICIWKGSAHDVLSNLHLRIILCNLHEWAVNSLRPQLSQYLDQWQRYIFIQQRNAALRNDPTLQSFGGRQNSYERFQARPKDGSSDRADLEGYARHAFPPSGTVVEPTSAQHTPAFITEAIHTLELTMERLLKDVSEDLINKLKRESENSDSTPRGVGGQPSAYPIASSSKDPTQFQTPTRSTRDALSAGIGERSQTAFKSSKQPNSGAEYDIYGNPDHPVLPQPKLVPKTSHSHHTPDAENIRPPPSTNSNGKHKSRASIKDEGYLSETVNRPSSSSRAGPSRLSQIEPTPFDAGIARVDTAVSTSTSTDYGSEVAWEECGDVP